LETVAVRVCCGQAIDRDLFAFVAQALARRFAIAFGDLPSELCSTVHEPAKP